MTLPAVFLVLALGPAESRDPAELRLELATNCHRLADAAPRDQRVPAENHVAAAAACSRAYEAAEGLAARAVLVFEAHSQYRRAHESGDKTALCTSATMLRTFAEELKSPGAEQRPNDRKSVEDHLAEIATQCPDKVAAASDSSASSASSSTPDTVEPGPKPDLNSYQPPPPVRRRSRIAGGVLLGLGLGLGVGTVGALVRGASLRAQADALNDDHHGKTIEDAGDFATITRRGLLADHLAIGLGSAAAALSIGGATLIAVDARRGKTARFAIQPSILPTAGIRLAMEF